MPDATPPDHLLRLEEVAYSIAKRSLWEQSNRVGLLWVHAIVGIVAGSQMLMFGTAPNIEQLVGVWSRLVLGVLGLVGGAILAYGVKKRPRAISAEAVGLVLLGLWDLAMTIGLAIARIQAADSPRWVFTKLPPPGTYVLPYPIAIYAGLFALISVHLWTLQRFRKGR